jgi:hypothetical protein
MNYATTLVSDVSYYRFNRVGEALAPHHLPIVRTFHLKSTTIRQVQEHFRRKGWRQTAGRTPAQYGDENVYYWRFARGPLSAHVYVVKEN